MNLYIFKICIFYLCIDIFIYDVCIKHKWYIYILSNSQWYHIYILYNSIKSGYNEHWYKVFYKPLQNTYSFNIINLDYNVKLFQPSFRCFVRKSHFFRHRLFNIKQHIVLLIIEITCLLWTPTIHYDMVTVSSQNDSDDSCDESVNQHQSQYQNTQQLVAQLRIFQASLP